LLIEENKSNLYVFTVIEKEVILTMSKQKDQPPKTPSEILLLRLYEKLGPVDREAIHEAVKSHLRRRIKVPGQTPVSPQ
jgi:hypothetical protein